MQTTQSHLVPCQCCLQVLSEGIHTLRLLPHASLEQIQGSSYRDFFWHSLGHYLGLDTHDARLIAYDRKFEPGTVITVEPGEKVLPLDV